MEDDERAEALIEELYEYAFGPFGGYGSPEQRAWIKRKCRELTLAASHRSTPYFREKVSQLEATLLRGFGRESIQSTTGLGNVRVWARNSASQVRSVWRQLKRQDKEGV
jgi:hypothetical protein